MKRMTMYKKFSVAALVLTVVAVGSGATSFYLGELVTNQKAAALQQQITALQAQLNQGASATTKTTSPSAQVTSVVSQNDLLTAAVAKVTPAVVSIVISEDVPQLSITYENPFGDDPFFQNVGMRVPVYHQTGSVLQKVGAGTGFLVTSSGYIVTNRHVVEDPSASYTVLLSNGKQLPATVIYRDTTQDLAVVKISGSNYPTVQFGDSSGLKLGQSVAAIGNALGEYNNSVSVGIVSGLNRTVTAGDNGGSETLTGVIQTDAAINPGNSGGPLIDLNGDVIGINVATVLGSNNISFSIPINVIKGTINKVVK